MSIFSHDTMTGNPEKKRVLNIDFAWGGGYLFGFTKYAALFDSRGLTFSIRAVASGSCARLIKPHREEANVDNESDPHS
jgi:hypothetical protein